jgi:hypothetical protein
VLCRALCCAEQTYCSTDCNRYHDGIIYIFIKAKKNANESDCLVLYRTVPYLCRGVSDEHVYVPKTTQDDNSASQKQVHMVVGGGAASLCDTYFFVASQTAAFTAVSANTSVGAAAFE